MPSLIVVDDEPQIRTMLQAYLGRLGHEVRLAAEAVASCPAARRRRAGSQHRQPDHAPAWKAGA